MLLIVIVPDKSSKCESVKVKCKNSGKPGSDVNHLTCDLVKSYCILNRLVPVQSVALSIEFFFCFFLRFGQSLGIKYYSKLGVGSE